MKALMEYLFGGCFTIYSQNWIIVFSKVKKKLLTRWSVELHCAKAKRSFFVCMFNFLNWRGSEVKTIPSFCLVAFVFRLTWKTLKMSPEAPTRNRTYDNFFAQTHMWRTNIEIPRYLQIRRDWRWYRSCYSHSVSGRTVVSCLTSQPRLTWLTTHTR